MSAPRPLLLLRLLPFPAASTLFTALEAGFASLTWWQWGLTALLPGLAWLWLRHFSVLGCSDAGRADIPPSVPSNMLNAARRLVLAILNHPDASVMAAPVRPRQPCTRWRRPWSTHRLDCCASRSSPWQ